MEGALAWKFVHLNHLAQTKDFHFNGATGPTDAGFCSPVPVVQEDVTILVTTAATPGEAKFWDVDGGEQNTVT